MRKIVVKGLAVATLFAFSASNAQAICLDYWIKGPAACKEDPKEKNRIYIKGSGANINVEKDEARIAYEEKLNKDIDKFLANYGKPPREFVAFNLDPSMENAVRWVKKFNEEYERTMKIAVAWKQADQLFRQYKATGEILLPAESGVTESQIKYLKKAFEEDASDLPKVKGFGIDLPGDWDDDRMSRNYGKLDYKDEKYAEAARKLANAGDNSAFSLTALERKAEEDKKKLERMNAKAAETAEKFIEKPASAPIKQKKQEAPSSKKLEISYYFSAKCPFCEKFKPELKKAIAEYGKENVSLTCVDMTPGDRTPENVKGKVDCKWRPLLAGEMKQFGIKKTPSILVKRGNSSSLELLENYHNKTVLLKYFKNGGKTSTRRR